MEGAHPNLRGLLWPQELSETLAHLVRGLVGERHGAYRVWGDLVVEDEVRDARRKDLILR